MLFLAVTTCGLVGCHEQIEPMDNVSVKQLDDSDLTALDQLAIDSLLTAVPDTGTVVASGDPGARRGSYDPGELMDDYDRYEYVKPRSYDYVYSIDHDDLTDHFHYELHNEVTRGKVKLVIVYKKGSRWRVFDESYHSIDFYGDDLPSGRIRVYLKNYKSYSAKTDVRLYLTEYGVNLKNVEHLYQKRFPKDAYNSSSLTLKKNEFDEDNCYNYEYDGGTSTRIDSDLNTCVPACFAMAVHLQSSYSENQLDGLNNTKKAIRLAEVCRQFQEAIDEDLVQNVNKTPLKGNGLDAVIICSEGRDRKIKSDMMRESTCKREKINVADNIGQNRSESDMIEEIQDALRKERPVIFGVKVRDGSTTASNYFSSGGYDHAILLLGIYYSNGDLYIQYENSADSAKKLHARKIKTVVKAGKKNGSSFQAVSVREY